MAEYVKLIAEFALIQRKGRLIISPLYIIIWDNNHLKRENVIARSQHLRH